MLQHLYSLKRLNFRLLTVLLLLTGKLAAQQNYLEVPVRLEIEKGNMDEVVVKVKKDGKDAFTQSGAGKMRFKLDFNKKYSLIFTKPGYITKTIEINTKAPSARIANGFDPYKIGVKLFLQNAENMVIYNQPVAQIKYDQNLDEFNFDTDYSKSILSAVTRDNTETETETEQANPVQASVQSSTETMEPLPAVSNAGSATEQQASARASVASETSPAAQAGSTMGSEKTAERSPVSQMDNQELINTPPGNGNEEKAPGAPVGEGEESKSLATGSNGEENKGKGLANEGMDISKEVKVKSGSDEGRTAASGKGDEKGNRKQAPVDGSDVFKSALNPLTGSDTPTGYIEPGESEKITREDIVERNRVITRIRVTRKGIQTEYSRVYYSWGGLYYFKNNSMSISENLFVNWTGVRN